MRLTDGISELAVKLAMTGHPVVLHETLTHVYDILEVKAIVC